MPARLNRHLHLSALLGICALQCLGGQGGDPGNSVGPEQLEPDTECQVDTWAPDEAAPSRQQCRLVGSGADRFDDEGERLVVAWDCTCGDAPPVSAEGAQCTDALRDVCGVDFTAARFCTYALGSCFPESPEGEQWQCRCAEASFAGPVQFEHVQSDQCQDALIGACGESCSDAFGTCQGEPDTLGAYACSCSQPSVAGSPVTPGQVAQTPVSATGESCNQVLRDVCGSVCDEPAVGHCEYDDAPNRLEGFECRCEDGQQARIALDELPSEASAQPCRGAVKAACGERVPAPSCDSDNAEVSGRCTGRPYIAGLGDPEPASITYDCTCSATGAESVPLEAASCQQALEETCPDAIRPGSDPEGSTADYGHLCTSDEQCSGGTCYIPGTSEDPICAKDCSAGESCPDFARCTSVGNREVCLVACQTDAECVALNPAVNNPLYCMQSSAQTAVCVQQSEP